MAIARALCKEPALVVLDEATSSLDTPSEALIQAALANLLRGRTAFIIAHRLSTIVDADRIVVMDGGLIVQMGTHAQLMADRDGLYRRLCARQFGEGARSRRLTDNPDGTTRSVACIGSPAAVDHPGGRNRLRDITRRSRRTARTGPLESISRGFLGPIFKARRR